MLRSPKRHYQLPPGGAQLCGRPDCHSSLKAALFRGNNSLVLILAVVNRMLIFNRRSMGIYMEVRRVITVLNRIRSLKYQLHPVVLPLYGAAVVVVRNRMANRMVSDKAHGVHLGTQWKMPRRFPH